MFKKKKEKKKEEEVKVIFNKTVKHVTNFA